MSSLAYATYASVMQSNAPHVVISLNNVLSLCEQTKSMREMAGRIRHHRTTAPNVAFSPPTPPLVAPMPQSTMQRETQMASERYIRHRNEVNRQAREFLRTILAAEPQPYSVIVARAAEAGISFSTLRTAKQALRVASRKVNKSTTLWSLPPVVPEAPHASGITAGGSTTCPSSRHGPEPTNDTTD